MDPKPAYIPPDIPAKFLKPYSPAEVEPKVYEKWVSDGFFKPETCVEKGMTKADAPVFSIVQPPPNVTGTLHMGHALATTLEDIMTRYHRMRGFRTLWLPGTDHAAIATQSKVEGIIYKEEGKRRQDLGREELLKRIEKFAQDSHDTIVNQVKKLGASVDWSREAFTLDEKRNLAVRTAFKQMYDDGLIYRGYRIVNWDPKGQTTISDDEIVYTEGQGQLYTFKYSKDFPISIATTRPETKVGDTGVAVHPDDARYKQYIGKEYAVDFAGTQIKVKVVGDEAVDPAFGTGAVGVTPAHSHVDWDIAQRHNLPIVPVINEYAKMSVDSPLLKDKKVAEARAAVVEWLTAQGLLEKTETIPQNLATAERTGGVVEPLPKLQWFIDVNKKVASRGDRSFKDLMLAVITDKRVAMLPEHFERIYTHWITNLHDWCISRQIWYGHRVPVWYKGDDKAPEVYVGVTAPAGDGWKQDEDTLDTWFSSGLWTFSTLGWPEQTSDLATYHPTSILETGYDILPFWVARMILMSTYLLGVAPFKTVYLHGLMRNADGSKMSKSKGAIDPLEMCAKYGTDALRMSVIVGVGPGSDTKMSEDKIRAYKNFANKLWNIARFILTVSEKESLDPTFSAFSADDKKLMDEFQALLAEVTKEMDECKYYLVAEKLYAYGWHEFADIILEESKEIMAKGSEADKKSRKQLLLRVLTGLLKALHPFAPFVTEEIWADMPVPNKRPLIVETWPS
ncbi:MAG TPA: valine--tRNA ligase [Candidatus Paceibacterota bacterium]|nr:valine--tRNA ligase [Candidatus Paceibacterota bacterium]